MKTTLDELLAFRTVVDTGSISAAAEHLEQTSSGISRALSRLEQKLHTTLMRRTTRRLELTEEGEAFLAQARRILASVEEAEEQMALRRQAPAGRLRVNTASPFMLHVIVPLIGDFRTRYPLIELELHSDDRIVDLLERRIDLAIRVGRQEDSSLVARHVVDWPMLLCVAPAYLARCGWIATPQQLLGLDWIGLNTDRAQYLQLRGPSASEERLRLESRIACNNILAVRQFTLAGMGVSLQPEPEIRELLSRGELLNLLPEWRPEPIGLYIVTPRRDAQPAKVRYAIEALRQHLQAF